MEIPILVEPVEGAGFRAVSGAPLDLVAVAPTRDAAIARLQELIRGRLHSGAEIVLLPVAQPQPLAKPGGLSG